MFILTNSIEKAKFNDVLHHIEHEQLFIEHMSDETWLENTRPHQRDSKKFINLLLGMIAVFTSSFLK
jgi:hypothetical protein